MSDTPIADALRALPANQLTVEGGVNETQGANLHGTLAREKGSTAFGVDAGVSQKKGWTVAGFFKKVWK